MDEATKVHLNLKDQTKFRLNEINKTRNYFIAEIQERETMSKRLSKNIEKYCCLYWHACRNSKCKF